MTQSFIRASNVLEARLGELENCAASDISPKLLQIIKQTGKLSKAAHLPDLLGDVPARDLDPSLAKALNRRLGKLARYYSFTRYLYQTAKNTKLFRHAVVKSVTLPPGSYVKVQSTSPQCNLEDCLGRCQQTKNSKKQLYQTLGVDFTQMNDEITATVRRTASGSKIHAEIQILAHYELMPAKVPPRVISSNKDACYLCQELIQIHGKYQTPRSHGRLYPGWKLPNLAAFPPLQKKMNQALESRIAIVCRQILTSGRKLAVDYPIESTIFELSTSMSTIPSLWSVRESLVAVTCIEPSRSEDVTISTNHEEIHEDTEGISSPKQVAEDVIPERATGKRTDSGYGSMPRPGNLDHDPTQNHEHQLIPPEITRPLQPSSPGTGEPLPASGEACPKDNTSSVETGAVQRAKAPGIVPILVAHSGPNSAGPENRTYFRQGKGEERASSYGGGLDIPASIGNGNSSARHSTFILRKGVVVQCRPTDYTSFRAGALRIFPELATDSTLRNRTTDCKLRVEWLEYVHEGTPVTDVCTLSDSVETDASDRFFLRHEKTVLRVETVRS